MVDDFASMSRSLTQVSLVSLQACASWQEKYKMLIDWGRQIPLCAELRRDDNRVPGCDAAVWLAHRCDSDGKYVFFIDSDSHVIKGLAALLLQSINGKLGAELRSFDADELLIQAGLKKHLSVSRANGLNKIRERIVALTHLTQ